MILAVVLDKPPERASNTRGWKNAPAKQHFSSGDRKLSFTNPRDLFAIKISIASIAIPFHKSMLICHCNLAGL
jgi:hypothetical protein